MNALKDYIDNHIGLSTIVASPLWWQAVDSITTAQLCAFVAKQALDSRRDEAESVVALVLARLREKVTCGDLPEVPMLKYRRSTRVNLSIADLRAGLAQLPTVQAAAVMFALETDMTAYEVGRLTHFKLARLRLHRNLGLVALECLRGAPKQHPFATYVFYELDDAGEVTPLFDLDSQVFLAFGLLWSELQAGYHSLSLIDYDANAKSVACFFGN